jgi:glycosyltransferase involved in cell wall biosynthesis
MRILLATANRGMVGGIETYLRALLPTLLARGHEVALLHEHAQADGDAGILLDQRVPAWLAGGPDWLRLAVAWRPDVVYLQRLDDPGLEEALLGHFPVVLFAHGYYGTCVSGRKAHGFPRAQPCGRTFGPACLALYFPCRCGGLNPATLIGQYREQRRRSALLPRYRAVVVASRHMEAEYRRHGVAGKRLVLLHLFPPGQEPDPKPPVSRPMGGHVLMVGRLTDLKGGNLLVAAVHQAQGILGRPLHLTVAGDGPQRVALETMARRAGLRAEFTGWIGASRRVELMRAADILAVPSIWPEPFGLVGIEAGCVGLPAVAYAVGGIPDWLSPGESGELAPGDPPSVRGLAEALVRALADPAHLAHLRHGAWQMARRYTPERHLAALEAVFHDAAHLRSRVVVESPNRS